MVRSRLTLTARKLLKLQVGHPSWLALRMTISKMFVQETRSELVSEMRVAESFHSDLDSVSEKAGVRIGLFLNGRTWIRGSGYN